MSWHLAGSLVTLREQVNALWPNRSKIADGTIGDTAHSFRVSAHNPDQRGTVRAFDLTHDPANGCDAHALADHLLLKQDPRLRLVISRRRIGSGPTGISPGVWRPYTGSNPHDKHVHIEVTTLDRAEDTSPWDLIASPPVPAPPPEDDVTPQDKQEIIEGVTAAVMARLQPEGGASVGDELDRLRRTVRALAEQAGVTVENGA